jgi:hypothetical protein
MRTAIVTHTQSILDSAEKISAALNMPEESAKLQAYNTQPFAHSDAKLLEFYKVQAIDEFLKVIVSKLDTTEEDDDVPPDDVDDEELEDEGDVEDEELEDEELEDAEELPEDTAVAPPPAEPTEMDKKLAAQGVMQNVINNLYDAGITNPSTATDEQLAKVEGVGPATLKNIRKAYPKAV